MYLVAVMEGDSCKVLSWRQPNTLDTGFCVESLYEGINHLGKPEIFNNDQGAQFTVSAFTDVLKLYNVRIRMDGRGRVQDNIFIERLWWTLNYQYLYLWFFDNGSELRQCLERWFGFYNAKRSSRTRDNLTPDEVYFDQPHPFAEAT